VIRTPSDRSRRGFTIIEMLVVLGVIAILASILFIAGSAVTTRQKIRTTQNILITLDRILDVYMLERGTIPPYNPDQYVGTPGQNNGLQSYAGRNHPARPDAAVFLAQASGYGEVDTLIQSIPNEFVRSRPLPNNNTQGVNAPSIVDSWAESGWPVDPENQTRRYPVQYQQVIYFVHPENTLAQALYGRCRNNRPYFMSAGPDRTYGLINEPQFNIQAQADGSASEIARLVARAISDNIYSTTVDPFDDSPSFQPAREWNAQ